MDIIENHDEWVKTYTENWLAHYHETGETNWKIYNRPNNKIAPSGKAVNLKEAKLILISSAGSYMPDSQDSYDAENDLGDYSIRMIPTDTAYDKLAFAHTHYDHTAVDMDTQVLIPTGHLQDLVDAGEIDSLTSNYISFMGYQPNAAQVVDETIPAIIEAAKAEGATAALLVPS